MANFTVSEYGKFVSLQNNSGSADSAAPNGGVVLFASGAVGSAKLYLQNEGGSALDVASLSVDIDSFSALGGAGLHQTQDHFLFSDNGTEKKITFSNLQDAVFADVSGDATIAAGGALTIAAGSIEHGMLAEDIISGQANLGGVGVDDADEFMFSDGGTIKALTGANLYGWVFGKVSGDATVAAGGGLTIANDAVESGMLNDNVISGQSALGSAAAAQADEMLFSDGGTLKKITFSNLEDSIFGNVSGDATIAAGGALTIAANAVQTGMVHDDVATELAGDGLAASSGVLAVGVDDSSIELNSDALRVKASGVTNAMLAGSIANAKLANDSVTVGSTEIDLGASSTVLAGITQLTASNIQVTNLDVVTLNSVSQTETTLEIADKLIVAALSASSANSDGGGLKIGGGQNSAGNASILYDHSNSALDFNIGGTTEIRLADGVLRPETDNDVDLGASGAEFKDLYLDGAANIDSLKMPDVTSGKLLVADGTSYEEVALSGDATLASNGALTIANDAVEQAMIADDAVGADQLASSAVVNASVVDGALKADKLDIDGSTDIGADLADADLMVVDDGAGGTNRKSALSRVKKYIYSAMSGDATASDAGVLTIAAQAVENSMLADDAVGADELAANAVVNASVASNAAIVATKLNFNVDFGGNVQFGTQTDDAVVFGGTIALGGNAIANAQGEATISLDNDQNVALAAAATVGGGYGSSGVTMSSAGAISADGALTIGADGAGVNSKFFGGAASEHMSYDAGNHVLYFANSGGTMLTIGGDATTEYALDVANGSDNINKVRAAAFVTYSDESLKSDVATMNTALDTVMSLNGVEFTWKDSGERDFGFIAQDVQSVLPKAVHTADDGVQGVDYSRLTSVLVEAVKAQQVQIEELKTLLKK